MTSLNIKPSVIEYPLLRSIYSGKAVKPADWLEELKKDICPEKDIEEMKLRRASPAVSFNSLALP